MDSDFIDKYAVTRREFRERYKDVYDEVVGDLIGELRGTPIDPEPHEERSLRAVAEAAIRYARELTRDRHNPVFRARYSKAEHQLRDELQSWQRGCELRAAEHEARRQAGREAQERAKKEERRRRREAKKAKLAADGSSTSAQ